ncbi:MAG TPA: DMT family transporter [bacterium]
MIGYGDGQERRRFYYFGIGVSLSTFGYAGEAAALSASVCWTATSLLFAQAGKRAQPLGMNMFRLPFAALCLGIFLWFSSGKVIPQGATNMQLWLLALSAFLGLAFGDGFYFRSLTLIGPRRATLLSASTPVVTALLAVPLLGEGLSWVAWGGILLTTGGIIWVIAEQHENGAPVANLKAGIIYGLMGAFGQATGLLVAKIAMNGTMAAIPTAFFRMFSAALMVWVWGMATGNLNRIQPVLKNKDALRPLLLASLLGPVTGVSLVLFAYRTTEAGVVATLSTLYPLLVVPVVWLRGDGTPTFRTIAGTVIAMVGVAIIFLR